MKSVSKNYHLVIPNSGLHWSDKENLINYQTKHAS